MPVVPAIQILVVLLVPIAAIGVLAARLRVPVSVLLVLAGVLLALVPGLPAVQLAPQVVLLLVLPPLIYSAAVSMSWREFRFNLRPISLLAIGCVTFTTLVSAAAAHWILGLPWPVGFVLGAIVSPPDAVAPLSIARRMQLPRRILVVLEGEGLANDATALILYRFAVVAVVAGGFSLGRAVSSFVAVLAGEILWGIAVGALMLRLRRWVRDPRIEITLSLITPFLAYWPAEYLGGSGVLATVTAGLYVSWNGLRFISAQTRLQGVFFWDFLVFLIEGLVFLVTGLQARTLLAGISGYSLEMLVISAALICAVVIVARFVWIYPATYVPRWLSTSLRRRDPAPPWQWPFALGSTGVRGIVSLAAALAIPLTTAGGTPFPARDLILFLAFAVILVTLVGQGLALPAVIRWLGLARAGERERYADRTMELDARREGIQAAIARLEQLAQQQSLPEALAEALRTRQRDRLDRVAHRADGHLGGDRKGGEEPAAGHVTVAVSEAAGSTLTDFEEVEALLIQAERERLNELYRESRLKDEPRRRIERELDLREAQLANIAPR